MARNISVAAFKEILSRAYIICSKRNITKGIQFLIDVFLKKLKN